MAGYINLKLKIVGMDEARPTYPINARSIIVEMGNNGFGTFKTHILKSGAFPHIHKYRIKLYTGTRL